MFQLYCVHELLNPNVEAAWTLRQLFEQPNTIFKLHVSKKLMCNMLINKKVYYHQLIIYFHPPCFCMYDDKAGKSCSQEFQLKFSQLGTDFSDYSDTTWKHYETCPTNTQDVVSHRGTLTVALNQTDSQTSDWRLNESFAETCLVLDNFK